MACGGFGDLGRLWFLAHAAPGGMAGGEPGAWRHQELWPGTGNCESFRRSFCSRESIILWTLKTWRQHRRRYLADMQDPQYRHIRFVRVRNPRQAEALLRELEAQRSAGHI